MNLKTGIYLPHVVVIPSECVALVRATRKILLVSQSGNRILVWSPLFSSQKFLRMPPSRKIALVCRSSRKICCLYSLQKIPALLFLFSLIYMVAPLSMEFFVSFFNACGYMESAYMVTHLEILPPRVLFGKCPNPPQYSPQIICVHVFWQAERYVWPPPKTNSNSQIITIHLMEPAFRNEQCISCMNHGSKSRYRSLTRRVPRRIGLVSGDT